MVVRINVGLLDAAISYVLSLGADAIVLHPARIREDVAETAQAITEKYGALERF
ncbi:MAG: WYL domain-containing protein [Ktedonobacteraceae bacterium]